MSRRLCAIVLLFVVAACGWPFGDSPPSNLDDACDILRQKPRYARAFRSAERKWGAPVHVQMAIMYQESKFDANARTPYRWRLGVIPMGRVSSAYGYSQALDGTWAEYRQDTRRYAARRNNIHDAADFMGWYMAGTSRQLGLSMQDARNQYLAYQEGRRGFRRGSHRQKRWLLNVADKTASRGQTYQQQLRGCRWL